MGRIFFPFCFGQSFAAREEIRYKMSKTSRRVNSSDCDQVSEAPKGTRTQPRVSTLGIGPIKGRALKGRKRGLVAGIGFIKLMLCLCQFFAQGSASRFYQTNLR